MTRAMAVAVALAIPLLSSGFYYPTARVHHLAQTRAFTSMATQPRRDEKGYIIPEDLAYDLREGVSTALGASKVKAMPEPVAAVIAKVRDDPSSVEFDEVIGAIDQCFDFFGTKFVNGDLVSASSENAGSSKILSLAKMFELTTEETLACFGKYYRDVLDTPDGTDHGNIRNLMKTKLEGVTFPNGLSLTPKTSSFDGTKYSSDVGLGASSTIEGGQDWDVESDIWIP